MVGRLEGGAAPGRGRNGTPGLPHTDVGRLLPQPEELQQTSERARLCVFHVRHLAHTLAAVPIRRAIPDDVPALRTLWTASTDETTFTPYPGSAFSESLVTEHLAFLAKEAGDAVGCVYAALPSEHFGFVFGLYVRPPARRRALAQSLMRAVAEAVRGEGRRYVVLSVDTPNEAARSLYEQLGFVDAARTLRADIDELLERL